PYHARARTTPGEGREDQPLMTDTPDTPLPAPAGAAPPASEAKPPSRAMEPRTEGAPPAALPSASAPSAAPPGPLATVAAEAARPAVRRHHWIIRVTHWANAVLLFAMIASGLQIYGAFTHFGM